MKGWSGELAFNHIINTWQSQDLTRRHLTPNYCLSNLADLEKNGSEARVGGEKYELKTKMF